MFCTITGVIITKKRLTLLWEDNLKTNTSEIKFNQTLDQNFLKP